MHLVMFLVAEDLSSKSGVTVIVNQSGTSPMLMSPRSKYKNCGLSRNAMTALSLVNW